MTIISVIEEFSGIATRHDVGNALPYFLLALSDYSGFAPIIRKYESILRSGIQPTTHTLKDAITDARTILN